MKNDSKLQIAAALNVTSKALASSSEISELTIPAELKSDIELCALRARSDLKAIKYKFYNTKTNFELLSQNPNLEALIDEAENLRLWLIKAKIAKGLELNLHAFILKEYTIHALGEFNRHNINHIKLLKYFLFLELMPDFKSSFENGFLNFLKASYAAKVSQQNFDLLKNNIFNQSEFCRIILALFKDFTPKQNEADSDASKTTEEVEVQEEEDSNNLDAKSQETENIEPSETEANEESLDEDLLEDFFTPIFNHSNNNPKNYEYKIYTKEFDQIKKAEDLIERSELIENRKKIDEKLADLKNITNHEAMKLKRKLLSKHQLSWNLNLEEGYINGSRLNNLIIDPTFTRIYKTANTHKEINTSVTLLIDNSGSMRGKPIMVAALCADILAKTLETCNIYCEILGFTTTDWQGGKQKKIFEQSGSRTPPGRLNGLLNIIYKDSRISYKRSRNNLGLMLKSNILKENIDGEALLWAANRLSGKETEKKILLVISDGAPIDETTLQYNGSDYLENHLAKVIADIEKKTNINLIAIGIGHDVSKYYKKAVIIKNVEELTTTLFAELGKVI